MSITISGIRVKSISISDAPKASESNGVSGAYEIISSVDKVLATQSFNSYADMKIAFSPDTLAALNTFLAGVKADISATIGV